MRAPVLWVLVLALLATATGGLKLNKHVNAFDHVRGIELTDHIHQIAARDAEGGGEVVTVAEYNLLLTFTAFNRVYRVHLVASDDEVLDPDVHSRLPSRVLVYRGEVEGLPSSWARFTLRKDRADECSGLVHTDADTFIFDPAQIHVNHPDTFADARARIQTEGSVTIVYRLSDIRIPSDHKMTGRWRAAADPDASAPLAGSESSVQLVESDPLPTAPTTSKRPDIAARSVPAPPVPGCGLKTPRTLTVGFAFDSGFLEAMDLDSAAAQAVDLVNIVTEIYERQFNIRLKLGPVHVRSACHPESWNQHPKTRGKRSCSNTIDEALNAFTGWRGAASSDDGLSGDQQAGAWILLTDCYPGPGAIGLANTAHVCRKGVEACRRCDFVSCTDCRAGPCTANDMYCGSGTAVVTYVFGYTWYVFAHELGHLLGAHHDTDPANPHHGFMGTDARWAERYFTATSARQICESITEIMADPAKNCFETERAVTDL